MGHPPVLWCCLSSLSSLDLNEEEREEERREWRRRNPSCSELPKRLQELDIHVKFPLSLQQEFVSHFHVTLKGGETGGEEDWSLSSKLK